MNPQQITANTCPSYHAIKITSLDGGMIGPEWWKHAAVDGRRRIFARNWHLGNRLDLDRGQAPPALGTAAPDITRKYNRRSNISP